MVLAGMLLLIVRFHLDVGPVALGAALLLSLTRLGDERAALRALLARATAHGYRLGADYLTATLYDPPLEGQLQSLFFRRQANETEQACSTGPFFPGQQLRVVLKTIIPLYTCRTPTNTTVNITERDGPGGITELVADCPAENPKQAP